MGCVKNIKYNIFPEQSNYVGQRVEVCYHYDTSKTNTGIIVRDDNEEPFKTIIALDNGKYLRGCECQYTLIK